MTDTVDAFLPLPPATFHILMALAAGPLHGYAIMQDIEHRSGGAMRLNAGSLYRSIARMVEQGLVEETMKRRTHDDDERRRYYSITPLGTSVAGAEMRRMTRLVRWARSSGLSPEMA